VTGTGTGTGTGTTVRTTAMPRRVFRLHLATRGVPGAMLAIGVCAVALRVILHWNPSGAGPGARIFPLLIGAGAASIVGIATRSPFGEAERATGHRLVALRLIAALVLTLVAIAALAAGSAGAHLQYGVLGLVRDVGGLIGVALIVAVVTGGTLSWLGPLSLWATSAYAINERWTTPLLWPDRPPHDGGAALCATVVFVVGLALLTTRGARDCVDD
jgi:hypothetical protein